MMLELGIFLLEGLKLLRGVIRTGNRWLQAAAALLIVGPALATVCRMFLHSPNAALAAAFLPIVGAFIWILVAGPLWLFLPEILSLGGSLTDGVTAFAKEARNKFLSWTGVSLVLGILASVLPSENSVRWTFIAAGIMVGSALWNVSPPSVKFHWWAWLTVVLVVAMLLLGGPDKAGEVLEKTKTMADTFLTHADDKCDGLPAIREGQAPPLAKGRNAFQVLPGEKTGFMGLQPPMNKLFTHWRVGGDVWVKASPDGPAIPMAGSSDAQGVHAFSIDNSRSATPACIKYETMDTHARN